MLFNEKKAAHVAAYFLHRGEGRLDILKLMKLMYLAERTSFAKYGEPITGDLLSSLPHGPILSKTLNHMNGIADPSDGIWDEWVADREGHMFVLNRPVKDARKDLSALSDAELEILEDMWTAYGHLTGFQLRDLTHEICAEWERPDPDGPQSTPITLMRLLRCVGHSAEVASQVNLRLRSQRRLDAILKAE